MWMQGWVVLRACPKVHCLDTWLLGCRRKKAQSSEPSNVHQGTSCGCCKQVMCLGPGCRVCNAKQGDGWSLSCNPVAVSMCI
jgi:hypothetical protein